MPATSACSVRAIGMIHSALTTRRQAPKQGAYGAPSAWIEIDPAFAAALDGIHPGSELFILTWLHESNRDALRVHPRGDPHNALRGVFITRSPDRPNPIGLHPVRVVEMVDYSWLKVEPIEAIDGTPVIDIKPMRLDLCSVARAQTGC